VTLAENVLARTTSEGVTMALVCDLMIIRVMAVRGGSTANAYNLRACFGEVAAQPRLNKPLLIPVAQQHVTGPGSTWSRVVANGLRQRPETTPNRSMRAHRSMRTSTDPAAWSGPSTGRSGSLQLAGTVSAAETEAGSRPAACGPPLSFAGLVAQARAQSNF
jgi:hypothetical protein